MLTKTSVHPVVILGSSNIARVKAAVSALSISMNVTPEGREG